MIFKKTIRIINIIGDENVKKICVNQEKCIGCGACVAIDPEHFEFNDEGKSSVISNENVENENVLNAIESCPTGAISLSEENKEETQECNCCQECDECKKEDE